MSDHRISVVIPVHNGERYLAQALESVFAQTYPAAECWVIDDGSTDGTVEIAERFSAVRVVSQGNAGAAHARNQGISRVTGDLIAFLDADDLWLPDKLALQVKALDDHSGTGIVFGMVEQFHSPELSAALKAQIYCTPVPVPGYLPSACMVRADVFQRVGLLNVSVRQGEFIDWCARARDAGVHERMLPHTVTRRRLHNLNQRAVKVDQQSHMVDMLKGVLDRRRAAGA
ncbi:MAG: glycosyltransferase family A protein [bacterium]|nr:glycosyltransferase family A protein [bacterium]